MRYIKQFALCISLAFLLCGCVNYIDGTNIKISAEDQCASDLVTTIYPDDVISQISETRFETIHALHESYPVEYVRYLDNWNTELGEHIRKNVSAEEQDMFDKTFRTYEITYIGESSLVKLCYSTDGSFLQWKGPFAISQSSEDFKHINVGDTYDDVYAVDPNGSYPVVGLPSAALPYSFHYTTDRFYIEIKYDYIVENPGEPDQCLVYVITDIKKTAY